MKKINVLLLILAVSLLSVNYVFAKSSNDVPNEVYIAATKGLDTFKTVVSQRPSDYGFASQSEVEQVTIGKGFKIYYINPEKLKSSDGSSLTDLSMDSNTWEFLILLNGKPKSFMTIGIEEGQYKVVHFGGDASVFGHTLENYNMKAKEKNIISSAQLLKSGLVYYFVAKDNGKEYILPAIPPEKAKSFGNMDNSNFKTSNEVITYLKGVQKNDGNQLEGVFSKSSEINNNSDQIIIMSLLMITLLIMILVYYLKRKMAPHDLS